jgi:hypothetical protein
VSSRHCSRRFLRRTYPLGGLDHSIPRLELLVHDEFPALMVLDASLDGILASRMI